MVSCQWHAQCPASRGYQQPMPCHNQSPNMRRRTVAARARLRAFLIGCVCLLPGGAVAADEHFDCVDAFELIVLVTTLRCAGNADATAPGSDLLAAARDKLIAAGFYSAADFVAIDIRWCPLMNALGFTHDAGHIVLASGLANGSADLVAEVLAHEMVHVRQFRERGADGFRCDYVNAFIACAGCQDRGHALEAEAYTHQDEVREHLYAQWLSR